MNKKSPLKRWEVLSGIIIENGLKFGAEIGVKSGKNFFNILRLCPDFKMVAVDPWDPNLKYQTWPKSIQRFNEKVFDQNAKNFEGRVNKIKAYSKEASEKIPDASLDIVFIDGDHSFAGVITDLESWLPKIRSGGFICGHDYGNPVCPEVKPAVDKIFDNPAVLDDYIWCVKLD